jgi:hypothetical protein
MTTMITATDTGIETTEARPGKPRLLCESRAGTGAPALPGGGSSDGALEALQQRLAQTERQMRRTQRGAMAALGLGLAVLVGANFLTPDGSEPAPAAVHTAPVPLQVTDGRGHVLLRLLAAPNGVPWRFLDAAGHALASLEITPPATTIGPPLPLIGPPLPSNRGGRRSRHAGHRSRRGSRRGAHAADRPVEDRGGVPSDSRRASLDSRLTAGDPSSPTRAPLRRRRMARARVRRALACRAAWQRVSPV